MGRRRKADPLVARAGDERHLRIVTVEFGGQPVHPRCAIEGRCLLSEAGAPPPQAEAPPLGEVDAGKYIGFTAAALRRWRYEKRGPAFIRVGRSVRYRVADLDIWLDTHRVGRS